MPQNKYGRRRPYLLSHLSEKLPTMGCTTRPVTAPAAHVNVVNDAGTPKLKMYDVCVANSARIPPMRHQAPVRGTHITLTSGPRELHPEPWHRDHGHLP